jgi:prolyl-tRNA synthetase
MDDKGKNKGILGRGKHDNPKTIKEVQENVDKLAVKTTLIKNRVDWCVEMIQGDEATSVIGMNEKISKFGATVVQVNNDLINDNQRLMKTLILDGEDQFGA